MFEIARTHTYINLYNIAFSPLAHHNPQPFSLLTIEGKTMTTDELKKPKVEEGFGIKVLHYENYTSIRLHFGSNEDR